MTALVVRSGSDPRIGSRRLALVPTKLLVDSPRNANVMTEEEEASLAVEINESGPLQTLLVVERKGKYVIVDGNHRAAVLRKSKFKSVPVIIADMDDDMVIAKGLSMNKLKGNQDLRIVSEMVQYLAKEGWSADDLKATRFPDAELAMLVKSGEANLDELEDELLNQDAPPDDADDAEPLYSVTIDFKAKKNRDLFNRAIKKASKGKGKSIGAVALAKAFLGGK